MPFACARPPPAGTADWPQWDAEVFGGNYTNHHGNDLKSTVTEVESPRGPHVILQDVPLPFAQGGSLYRTSPLNPRATLLLEGRLDVGEAPAEPVAWTYIRPNGGRSFYTSLGHSNDFGGESFPKLLENAIGWALAQ